MAAGRDHDTATRRREPVRRRLAASDGRPVLLAVHPGAIPVIEYEALCRRLEPDVRVEVLAIDELPAYREAVLAGTAVQVGLTDLVAGVVDEVGDAVAGVPYVVLGWSFGAVVACALAEPRHRLAAPRRLMALDSIAPRQGRDHGDALPVLESLDWFAMYLGARRHHDLRLRPSDFEGRGLDAGLELVLSRAVDAGALPAGTSAHALRKVYDAFDEGMRRNKSLQDSYFPERLDVPVTLVRPKRGLLDRWHDLGWGALTAQPLESLSCPGDHYTMLRDAAAVEVVASRARADLERPLPERNASADLAVGARPR